MNVFCPCCRKNLNSKVLFTHKRCPVLNNVVYHSPKEAQSCSVGSVNLIHCIECGFVFNESFDKSLIFYDESYDNTRKYSSIYKNYLTYLSEICANYLNNDDIVMEIGCGKGDFLKNLSDTTGCKAVGYDCTYDGKKEYKNKILFHKKYYQPQNNQAKYDMLIFRHMLEHIAEPNSFLEEIFKNPPLKVGKRILIEVPRLEWILEKCAFYDITYEHCNYFIKETLISLVNMMGFESENLINVFGGQYSLLIGVYRGKSIIPKKTLSLPKIEHLFKELNRAKLRVEEIIDNSDSVSIWGASGKGVTFLSNISKRLLDKISYVIDINPSKQGKFLPVSGKRVDPPNILKNTRKNHTVIVMNWLYNQEIQKMVDEMKIMTTLVPV